METDVSETGTRPAALLSWLNKNAAAIMVLISLAGTVAYLTRTLASKADLESVATKEDVDEIRTAFTASVEGLNAVIRQLETTTARMDVTVASLQDTVAELRTTSDEMGQTSRLTATCIVDVHLSTQADIQTLMSTLNRRPAWPATDSVPPPIDLDPSQPRFPRSCEELRSQ
jgi:uncharacterized coiled-coil protein SlyX